MPPEPFPWGRKEFFRERKHQNGYDRASEPLVGPVSRWRDSPSHGSRNDFGRWGYPPEFRRPPGHGKQGGWHLYPEDLPHGYSAARSDDRFFQDGGGFRPSGPYRDGRYNRNFRENKGSFNQKGWRSHSWDTNNHHGMPPYCRGRSYERKDQKLADVPGARISHPRSDEANTSNQLYSKEHDDAPYNVNESVTSQKIGKENTLASADWKPLKEQDDVPYSVNGSVTSQKIEKETTLASADWKPLKEQDDVPYSSNGSVTSQKIEKETTLASADWKLLKWCRSGSLTSRGSGFSLSSNSKSTVESCDMKIELPLKIATPDESCSGDAVGCLTSPASLEDTSSRKKPRLGWGEGLAKFEKKIVEGPEDCQMKNSSMLCTGSMESMLSPAPHLAEKSVRTGSSLECRSPVTPSSAVCTSSPGFDDKSYVKTAEIDSDANNLSPSPTARSQNHFEELSLSPENMDYKSLSNLNRFLNELLQNEVQGLADSEFRKASGLNKLLMFRGEIAKTLESTESEIDSLENELKSMSSQPDSDARCPESSNSMSLISKEKPCAVLNMVQRPPSLMIVSSGDVQVDGKVPCGTIIEDAPAEGKDECVDSPGTATSKLMEPLSSDKFSRYDQQRHGSSGELSKYEVCTSVEKQIVAGSSAPGAQSKVAKDGNTPVHKQLRIFDTMEENEALDIFSSNKETAVRTSNVLNNLLPCSSCAIQSVEAISDRCSPNNLLIKEKFLTRERSVRFKERALCLKYRVLQYLWKEDLQLLSERKYPAKSQKKVDSGNRSSHGGSQKHRSSVRLRVVSPACKTSLFPKSEVVRFTGKLLSSPQIGPYRGGLKMPSLMLDKQEKKLSMFPSSNGLVEHPLELEKERALTNPWTTEEKEIFLEKYSALGKDFQKISSFLDHKTTADCVEFYYKNHKSDLFEKTKQQKKLRKQEKSALTTRYLMTSGTASLDLLGAASAFVAKDERKEVKPVKIFSSGRKLRINGTIREISRSYDEIEDERETEAADVLASICGSLSSEATSSYVTSSADPYSDESCEYMADHVDWTDEEKSSFMQAFSSYGKDFVMISRFVQTKSRDQCKVFFGKARKCLGLDGLLRGNDQEGGRSDAEDPCVVEDDVGTCGDRDGLNGNEGYVGNPMELDVIVEDECVMPVQLDASELKGRLHNLPSLGIVVPE